MFPVLVQFMLRLFDKQRRFTTTRSYSFSDENAGKESRPIAQ
jgi:hypothetical protein